MSNLGFREAKDTNRFIWAGCGMPPNPKDDVHHRTWVRSTKIKESCVAYTSRRLVGEEAFNIDLGSLPRDVVVGLGHKCHRRRLSLGPSKPPETDTFLGFEFDSAQSVVVNHDHCVAMTEHMSRSGEAAYHVTEEHSIMRVDEQMVKWQCLLDTLSSYYIAVLPYCHVVWTGLGSTCWTYKSKPLI